MSYGVGNDIYAGVYNFVNFTPYQYTLAFRIQHYTTGSTQYLFDYFANTGNTISVYISGATTTLKHVAGGTERIASGTTSAVPGTLYNLICRGDSSNKVDLVNYLKIDFGESSSAVSGGTASSLGTLDASGSTLAIGQTWRRRGESVFDGRLWFQIDNYSWDDAEVVSFINSGSPNEPIVSSNTKLMLSGAMSNSLPQCIYYNSSGSTFSDDYESGVGSYTAINAAVASETSAPIADLKSMKITAVSGGGYGRRSFAVSSSTTYVLDILTLGVSGETCGIQIAGDVSGTLETDLITADGNEESIPVTFTTGASDTSVEVRFFDDLESGYKWNGEYAHTTDWCQSTVKWNDAN